jgi:hypothetical protein
MSKKKLTIFRFNMSFTRILIVVVDAAAHFAHGILI